MKLATIQKVKNVRSHPNADRLKIANVNEYQVVTAADIKDGDLVVYFALDSILPDVPVFEFLRKNKFRVSMVKLRGEASNGLIIPLDEIEKYFAGISRYEVGEDISTILQVEKYSKPVPANLAGEAVGQFPTELLSKTDEERFENEPELLERFKGKEVYVSLKIDGSSVSYLKKNYDELRVCSRNLELKEKEDNTLWKIAKKYDLYRNLKTLQALQGEAYGEGIQKNPLGIKGQDVAIFNVIDLHTRKLMPLDDSLAICEDIGIPFVPIVYRGIFKWDNIQELKTFANEVRYENGEYAEGIVLRLTEPEFCAELNKELSVKVISENYKD